MQFNGIGYDEMGISSFKNEAGQVCHNPFEIALQAILGKDSLNAYKDTSGILIPRYFRLEDLKSPVNDEIAKKAMKWIQDNGHDIDNGRVWDYDYNGEYEGNKLIAPWHSSYGQAYIIFALLQWNKYSGDDKKYYDLLIKAIKGLITPVEEGGCMVKVPEGCWFEEIIGENQTHIFNAHLISLIALIYAKNYIGEQWIEEYINQGIEAFNVYSKWMDTGNYSAYDIKESYDIGVQLRPEFLRGFLGIKSIKIKSEKEARVINLQQPNCFDLGLQWIAGIDWSEVNEDGYRKVLDGYQIRGVDEKGMAQQHTYAYFAKMKRTEKNILLEIKYEAEFETTLSVYKNCGELGFRPLGFTEKVQLMPGKHTVKLNIPCESFQPNVTPIYHKYHIQLLEELIRLGYQGKMYELCKYFKIYEENTDIKMKNVYPELTGIAVSVNEQCGLFCKMCDLGIKNKESSMYFHMKPGGKDLDVDLLLQRCLECGENLKIVQFIGTEPTLYSPLPYAVSELIKMGKRVLVTTNGINLKNQLEPLLKAGLSELYISIDGPSEVHDNIRGKKGLFNDIMNLLKEKEEIILEAKKKGFILGIGVAITPMNYLFLKQLVDEISHTEIKSIWCTHMNFITEEIADSHCRFHTEYPIGASCTNREMDPMLINPWEMEKSIREANERANDLGISFVCVPDLKHYTEYETFYHKPEEKFLRDFVRGGCTAPYRTMQINSDGRVCIMSRCYQFELGNIKESTLDDLFYSQPMAKFRKAVKEELWDPCKRCCAIM